MKKIILTVLIGVLTLNIGDTQETLKDYLINFEENSSSNPEGLREFRNADYKSAYDKFKSLDSTKLFNYSDFLYKSLLYQRDSTAISSEFINGNISLDEFRAFFIHQNQMNIVLNGKTTVDLDKNLLTGIVGNDTIRILFDTGGDGISISKKFVDKYKMVRDTTIKREGYVPAFNYRSISHPTIIPVLRIGNMTMTNVPAKYKEEEEKSERKTIDGPQFDMIMGMNMFVGFIKGIEFNWTEKTLTFNNEVLKLKNPVKYIMFDSKPVCLFSLNDQYFTSLLDTGSPVDLMSKDIYLNNYIKKEAKKYGDFSYIDYTVKAKLGENTITLVAADYLEDLNLSLNDESIPFIIGNNKQYLKFDLTNCLFEIK
jgi:hypothetical protein